ncbi:hypothetical protein Y032_0581g280 [Ancylostoma ceylanicum]|nr:hypothetical protein Y032_0581g280 [Ancylostoma ceylanicum]
MALIAVHSHLLFVLLTTYFNLLVFVLVGGQKAFHIFAKGMSHRTAAQLEEQFEGIKVLISFSLHCATFICTVLCVLFTNAEKIKAKMPPTVVSLFVSTTVHNIRLGFSFFLFVWPAILYVAAFLHFYIFILHLILVVVILIFTFIFNLIAAILLVIYKQKDKGEERHVLLASGIVSGIAVLLVVGVVLYFIKWPPNALVVVEIPLPQKPANVAPGGPVNVVPVVPANAPPIPPVKPNESDEYFK